MAAAAPSASSSKETTNYARLCRLLVGVGTQALRDTFDAIHAPATLHTVLAGNKATLQSLRTRKIINPTQWGKLFPAIPHSVSSRDFDTTLLMVLLRNICGLPSPITGWDTLPAVTDVTCEADIARVKYFRNTVYAHAEQASVDDKTFKTYWQDIRDTLVRLGGAKYGADIDNLETECMDPEIEDHCKELLSLWKKDEDNIKDELKEIGTEIRHVKKTLDVLAASSVTNTNKENSDEGKSLKLEEVLESSTMCCRVKNHENEPLEYYCEECKVPICGKCGQTRHTHHTKVNIQQAAEDQKLMMLEALQGMKVEIAEREKQMEKKTELSMKSKEKITAVRNNVLTTVEELIRVLKEHETVVGKQLDDLEEAEKSHHATQLEHFETSITNLKMSVECCETTLQGNISFETLQTQRADIERCKSLLKAIKMDIYKPSHVRYNIDEAYVQNVKSAVPGKVDVSNTDPLRSIVERLNQKAEVGCTENFTIITNDSDGKQCYHEIDQITVKVQTPSEKVLDNKIENYRRGSKYSVSYAPKCHGHHQVVIEINDQPLTGSPWSVQVHPHQYSFLEFFGSRGKVGAQFKEPCEVAVSQKTGDIAVADQKIKKVQLFNTFVLYVRDIEPKGQAAKKLTSVALTNSGCVIVIASGAILCFSKQGEFIKTITNEHLQIPFHLTIGCDDRMVVCDTGDRSIKVLSPDGSELLQSFSAPDCDDSPWTAVSHQDMFFVSYPSAHCVKAFGKEGEFLYDIGNEQSGDGQLSRPLGLTIDVYNNLVVCDEGNRNLQVFTLEGRFLNSIAFFFNRPLSVAVQRRGFLLIVDAGRKSIVILR